MRYGAILAGGVGNRMKSAHIPKQFLEIAGKPIIIWTLERLMKSALFDEVIIAIHPEWNDYLKTMIRDRDLDRNYVQVIDGGKERLDSIQNVIDYIENAHGINADDKILIHDAVRPFVTDQIMKDSMDALDEYPAVVAAIPATDTMLWIEEGTKVDSMPARSKLFHGQAPDSFRLQVLRDSLDSLTEEEKKTITGTAQLCRTKGIEIHTVPGDVENIKLTSDGDLMIAEGIMRERLERDK